MSIKAEPSFSLKDDLFNDTTVGRLGQALAAVDPNFPQQKFAQEAARRFPELALKQRIQYLVALLGRYLPDSFEAAVDTLTRALPPPLDPDLNDNDFGQFIWVVPGEYVARHGCSRQHLQTSLRFLRLATMRFSSELAIRPFLAAFPDACLTHVHRWARDSNYHVRRLASEGIRPLLPWAQRVMLPTDQVLEVLNLLYRDPTRYVVRSVANNLNDLSRQVPQDVLNALNNWQQDPHPDPVEMSWLTRHALRTLIKNNHSGALALLGYPVKPQFRINSVSCDTRVSIGESLRWEGQLTSLASQKLKIFLNVSFLKKDGSHRPKVFTVKDLTMAPGEQVVLSKKVVFRPMTTRTLYPGTHHVSLIVNGVERAKSSFELTA